MPTYQSTADAGVSLPEGGMGGGNLLIFRPGGVAAGNVYVTLAALEAAALALDGHKIIEWDLTISAVINITSGTWTGITENAEWIATDIYGGTLITVDNGAVFTHLPRVIRDLTLEFVTTGATRVFTDGALVNGRTVLKNSTLRTHSTAILAPFLCTSQIDIILEHTSYISEDTSVELIEVTTGFFNLFIGEYCSVYQSTIDAPSGSLYIIATSNTAFYSVNQPNLTGGPAAGLPDFGNFENPNLLITEKANEGWIRPGIAEIDIIKNTYPSIDEAVRYIYAAYVNGTTRTIILNLPDSYSGNVDVDLSNADAANPVLIKGNSSGNFSSTQCILDFTPMNGVDIPCDLLVQDSMVLIAGLTIQGAVDKTIAFERCVPDSTAGIVYFTGSGNYTFNKAKFDNQQLTTQIYFALDSAESLTTVLMEESSFYGEGDDNDIPFFGTTSTDSHALNFTSIRNEFRYKNMGTIDVPPFRLVTAFGGSGSNLISRDDRLLIEENASGTSTPLPLFDGSVSGFDSISFTNLKLRPLNETQTSDPSPYDAYIEPGVLLQEALDTYDADINWEVQTQTRYLDNTDSPASMLAEDYYVECDTSAGVVIYYLVEPYQCPGREVIITRIGANIVTLDASTAGGTINGNPSFTLSTTYSTATIKSTGTDWRIL